MRKLAAILLSALAIYPAKAQIPALQGVINFYSAVNGIDTCSGRLELSDTTGFRAGGYALIVQIQGANVSTANNGSFGAITDQRAAGRFERIRIDSVAPGAVFATNRLVHVYDLAGRIQLVSFPYLKQAVVADTLFAKPWDGRTGGIIAFAVTDTLFLDAPVVADGAGFRGGADFVAPLNNCTWLIGESDYAYGYASWRGSFKGEGIAMIDSTLAFGRGPLANGGGGGNDHNAGGGGGANSSAGGRGGENDEPSVFGCDGYYPGLGGRALPKDSFLLFFGGGGGAGHANNNLSSAGGNGGGVILIEAGAIAGASRQLTSDGFAGRSADGDGGGGGGGGGTIWLRAATPSGSIYFSIGGGQGGNTFNNNQNRCFGPGGGGGGGRICTNVTGTFNVSGGEPGIVTGSSNACNGTHNGAGPGLPGDVRKQEWSVPLDTSLALRPKLLVQPLPLAVCAAGAAQFEVLANSGDWQYQWEINSGNGWSILSNGQGFSGIETPKMHINPVDTALNGAAFRCAVRRGNCTAVVSDPSTLQVIPPATAGFIAAVSGDTARFTNTSANAVSFWWDFGDGSAGPETAPTHVFPSDGNYTVTLFAVSACDTAIFTQFVAIATHPVAAFSAPDSVRDCSAAQVVFTNQSSANAAVFFWYFPGGVPGTSSAVNPVVNYFISGTYTITLIAFSASGADTAVGTLEVELLGYPDAAFTHALIGNRLVQFTNNSKNADTFTWYFGDGSTPVHTTDASHQYAADGIFTVTLVGDNFCGTSVIQKSIEIETVGAAYPAEEEAVFIYPNPAFEFIVVDCSPLKSPVIQLRFYDASGKIIWQQSGGNGPVFQIPVQDVHSGMYALILFTDAGILRRKVVKR